MITEKNLHNEIEGNKLRIVKFLQSFLIISGILALILYTTKLISGQSTHGTKFSITTLIVIGLFILFNSYCRFFLTKKNLKLAYIITGITLLLCAIFISLTYGTNTPIGNILFITIILASTIVLGMRSTIGSFIFIIGTITVITILHVNNILPYDPTGTESDIVNSFIVVIFISIILYIAKTGYDQIEHSYSRAFDYSKELEYLNKNLDKKVRFRTKQLERSFDNQAELLHKAAVMGNVARPMIHDLSTPTSALQGSFELIDIEKLSVEEQETFNMAKEAVQQIQRIVTESRTLMSGETKPVKFEPYKLIDTLKFLILSELRKYEIEFENDTSKEFKIFGFPNLFERIILNLVMNSIEELSEINTIDKKLIKISNFETNKYYILEIFDNGNGISEDNLKYIFEHDFSMKKDVGNLGMGLPFVKSMIEKKFGGKIKVESELGEYTKFTLKFDKNFHGKN